MRPLTLVLVLLFSLSSSAQVTVFLQPHFTQCSEGTLYSIDTTSPYWPGNGNQYVAESTYYNYPDFCYNADLSNYDTTRMRHIICFKQLSDTTVIPHNAIIDNAVLHLYGVPSSGYGNWGNTYFTGSPWASSGPNPGWVYELADTFNAHTVTWRNAPGIKHNDSVAIAPSSARWNEDDSVDVTSMVADMVAHTNTGFLAKMQEEIYGHERVFGSGFYSDSTKHPSLKVSYHIGISGIEELGSNNASVSIYPNPASTILNVKLTGFNNGAVTVRIYDLLGQIVYQQHVEKGKDNISIATEGFPSSVYILEAVSGSSVTKKRFTRQ